MDDILNHPGYLHWEECFWDYSKSTAEFKVNFTKRWIISLCAKNFKYFFFPSKHCLYTYLFLFLSKKWWFLKIWSKNYKKRIKNLKIRSDPLKPHLGASRGDPAPRTGANLEMVTLVPGAGLHLLAPVHGSSEPYRFILL